MAADSDGTLTAVVICEGNLHDPNFPKKFRVLLGKLKTILQQPKSKKLKVNKLEPWNSVRVTLSIPKDAAARLRQLASEGSNALRALGILSVQLEGDTVISLRLVGQEIVLRTDNNQTACTQEAGPTCGVGDLTRILSNPMQTATTSCATLPVTTPSLMVEPIAGPSRVIPQSPTTSAMSPAMANGPNYDKSPIFKSPNTICPMDGKLPVPPIANVGETREYPFESMTQARVIQRRENTMAVAAALGQGQPQLPSSPVASVPASSQHMMVAGPTQGMIIGQAAQVSQTAQPPPPLAISAKPLAVSQQQSLQQEQSVKSQFVQPPPPPYPNIISNSTKTSLTVQHQTNTITLPVNSSLSSGSNNIAISSPLLVNLLQNDGVSQVKQHQQVVSAQKPPVVGQQQSSAQSVQSQVHQTIVSNIKSPQQQEILLNSSGGSHHSQTDGVLLQGGQIVVNNSGVVNQSNVSTNISLNPSLPVPSSLTISNISTLSNSQSSPHNTSPIAAITQSQTVNPNLLGPMPPNINIRMQQLHPQQQQRFPHQTQTQVLLRQQQLIQPPGTPIQRFSPQNQTQQQIMNAIPQQQFRSPVQQNSPQPQQYVTPPPSPHPNTITPTHTNIAMQTASVINHQQQHQSHQQQQIIGTSYNHPRWPFKPMDSATKSSFQEFTRYQMQYNLQQQMNQTQSVSTNNSTPSAGNEKQNLDPLGLVSLSDLDELTKNDLESLLPNLNVSDLDSALGLDGKNALESLLDAKDLDLDLIDQDLGSALTADFTNQPPQGNSGNNNDNVSCFPEIEPSLTSSGKQRQYLINPLTGELEPMPSEESDAEPEPENVEAFNEFNSEISNSLYSDDENSCSTAFSKASDHSDTERSSNSEASVRSRYSKSRKERRDLSGGASSGSSNSSKKVKLGLKGTLLREKLQQGIKDKISGKTKQPREKSSKAKLIATTTTDNKDCPAEKIKLRLKLEKSEPVTPAYKVDISFVQSPKRAQTAVSTSVPLSGSFSSPISSTTLAMSPSCSPPSAQSQVGNSTQAATSHQQQSPAGEELRVPPLHISLRGKNSIVIKNSKKDRKKSQSGGEEDDNYLKKSLLKRNHSNFEDQAITRSLPNEDLSGCKNNHHQHLINKILSHGKPTTRQSSDEYVTGSIHNKLIPPSSSNQVVENGDSLDASRGSKSSQSTKRNASELIHSPNGLICPETKRRRMSQTALEQLSQQQFQQSQEIVTESDSYHLKGPIGSTNVGTLPQHSSLSKNQKGANNNNSSNYSSKSGKNIKSGKPLVVVKSCKSPTHNVVKDPGKSPPTNITLSSATFLTTTVTSSIGDALVTSISNSSRTACLLPQGSSDAISEEKFKQKLLECRNVEKAETTSVLDRSGTEIKEEKSQYEIKMKVTEKVPFTPPDPAVTLSSLSSSKSTNSAGDVGNSSKMMKSKDSEDAPSYISKSSEDLSRQPLSSQSQETPSVISPKAAKAPGNEVGTQSTINTLTSNGNNIVRNSPGSQAQGEDSGIESMDALSEKSPHQSASPQQGDQSQKQLGPVHSKIEVEEKPALINHKDISVEEITSIGDIEAALAKMEGINEHFLTPCESPTQKFNGELAMKEETLLQNLTDEKIVFCAPKIEHDDLSEIMLGTSHDKKLECRDMNENKEISSKMSLEKQLVDECCKKNIKIPTNLESNSAERIRNSDCGKYETKVIADSGNIDIKIEVRKIEASKVESVEGSDREAIIKENLSNKEIMAPITIDIPVHLDPDAHRVRTRASSKLESPLDLPKQSPQLDSPAASIKSNLRLTSQSADRLSPKIITGKGAAGGGKRKRQGSESSVQSCVSDDTPGKGGGATNSSKRSRQNNNNNVNGGNGESVNNNSSRTLSISAKRGSSSESCTSAKSGQTKTKKNDESSDSDEPLIEVAGKVRNSKSTGKSSSSEAEKVLRNHRVAQIKAASTVVSVSGTTSNSSKTIRGANMSLTTFGANNSTHGAANMPTVVNSYSTRGANQVTNPVDDKIGTRRSVRASAAANKIIYSKSSVIESPKNSGGKVSTSSIPDIMDARRKTRSAAGSETPTEGRRRRGSRDGK